MLAYVSAVSLVADTRGNGRSPHLAGWRASCLGPPLPLGAACSCRLTSSAAVHGSDEGSLAKVARCHSTAPRGAPTPLVRLARGASRRVSVRDSRERAQALPAINFFSSLLLARFVTIRFIRMGSNSLRVLPGSTSVSGSSAAFLFINLRSPRTDGAAARWMCVSTLVQPKKSSRRGSTSESVDHVGTAALLRSLERMNIQNRKMNMKQEDHE